MVELSPSSQALTFGIACLLSCLNPPARKANDVTDQQPDPEVFSEPVPADIAVDLPPDFPENREFATDEDDGDFSDPPDPEVAESPPDLTLPDDGSTKDAPLPVMCIYGDCICNTKECGEQLDNDPLDCAPCGDENVSPGEGPPCCILDMCACPKTGGAGCGDGCCKGGPCGEDSESCPMDCGTDCGDTKCLPPENPSVCPKDCAKDACGNRTCDKGEDPVSCPIDCGAACGDCDCDLAVEDFQDCPVDCGYCGDGICSFCVNESVETCPKDCG